MQTMPPAAPPTFGQGPPSQGPHAKATVGVISVAKAPDGGAKQQPATQHRAPPPANAAHAPKVPPLATTVPKVPPPAATVPKVPPPPAAAVLQVPPPPAATESMMHPPLAKAPSAPTATPKPAAGELFFHWLSSSDMFLFPNLQLERFAKLSTWP